MLGQGSSPRKSPSSAMGRTPLRPGMVEDKGYGLPLRVALWVIPWNRISTRTEKGQRKEWKYLRESCHYCIKCYVPNRAMLFSLYNHFQRLWGGDDGTSISTLNLILHVNIGGEEGSEYKMGGGRQSAGPGDHYHSRRTRKSSSDCAEDQPSLINSVHPCLIVMNTILTVIYTLKPSSLIHSLQIYCTGFTGPRCHTPWAWAVKRVPTIFIYFIWQLVDF